MNRHTRLSASLLLSAALAAGGCGFDPAAVPVPGTTIDGATHRLHIQFANVLNLPAQAKVFANGAQVGTVTGITVVDPRTAPTFTPGYAVVDIEIAESIHLPTGTRAELRQQTILGDVSVALLPPSPATTTPMPDGATITVDQTRPANQVEDTMAILAAFINGGSIDRFESIVEQLDSALPPDPSDTARIANTLAVNAADLAGNLDDLDTFLHGLDSATTDVAGSAPLLADILTGTEVQQLVDAVSSLINALGLFGRIAEISRALTWLAPALQAGDAAAKAVMPVLFTSRPFDVNAPSNLNLITGLLRDKIIPWVRYSRAVDLRSLTITAESAPQPSTDEQVDQVLNTLRMIGLIR